VIRRGDIFFYGSLKDGVMDYWTGDLPQPDGTKFKTSSSIFSVGPDKFASSARARPQRKKRERRIRFHLHPQKIVHQDTVIFERSKPTIVLFRFIRMNRSARGERSSVRFHLWAGNHAYGSTSTTTLDGYFSER